MGHPNICDWDCLAWFGGLWSVRPMTIVARFMIYFLPWVAMAGQWWWWWWVLVSGGSSGSAVTLLN